jgi:hypothetical protein
MIVDRYDPINLFELVPKLKLEMDPELAHLDRLLDDDASSSGSKPICAAGIPTRRGSGATPLLWR